MAWSGPGGGGGVSGVSSGCGAPRYSSQRISISLQVCPLPCCVLRFLVFRPVPSPVSPNIAAHRPGFASALACPAGTVLRFRAFWSGLRSVLPSIGVLALCLSTFACRHRTTLHPRLLTCCWCLIPSLPVAVAALCAAFSGFSAHPGPCFTQYRSTQVGFRVCP